MGRPPNLDLRARVEPLTYLVASQLLAKTTTGGMAGRRARRRVGTRLAISKRRRRRLVTTRLTFKLAQQFAQRLERSMPFELDAASATSMFCENPRLDFRAPFIRSV
jgi:hypothetical protein